MTASPDAESSFRRATTVPEARARLARIQTAAGAARTAAFRPRPDDVVIATFPKSGTTWMQQVVHGLRTGGSMDFDEITSVVPWIEMAHDIGQDLDADQPARPRAFKTHLPPHVVPRGCRTICVLRDPRDVAISNYYFFEGYLFDAADIPLEQFVREFILEAPLGEDYWSCALGWLKRARRDPVLVVFYEDMIDDLPTAVARVADFVGIDAAQETREIAARQASFSFMKEHVRKFDDHLIRGIRHDALGLPRDGVTHKVREGRVGSHRDELSPAILAEFDRRWAQQITKELGVEHYRELRRAMGTARREVDVPRA